MKCLSIDFILCGKINFELDLDLTLIAIGSTRKVYKVKNKPYVLKINKESFFTKTNESGISFKFNPDKMEWDIWNIVKDSYQEKYFATCIYISVCGQYLLMDYAPKSSGMFKLFLEQHNIDIKNVTSNDIYMIDVDLRNDINRFQNWGEINKSIVIIDYSNSKNIKYINKNLKTNEIS